MTREQSKKLKSLKKLLTNELKQRCKKDGLKYSYDTLYRFEGDFVYYAFPDIFYSQSSGKLSASLTFFIKPWILNETFWSTQEMDMKEMLSQPKTFHFRGAFTIKDIHYSSASYPLSEDKDDNDTAAEAAKLLSEKFSELINDNNKRLTDVSVILDDTEGYNIHTLTKAIAHIYLNKDYRQALKLLTDNEPNSGQYGQFCGGKSAEGLTAEYCKNMLSR